MADTDRRRTPRERRSGRDAGTVSGRSEQTRTQRARTAGGRGERGDRGDRGDRGVSNERGRMTGMTSLFNPLWCYHGFRAAVLGLSAFGVIMVFSSSAASSAADGKSPFTDSISQFFFMIVGLIAGFVCSMVPVKLYRRFGFVLVLLAIGGQILTFTSLGVSQYGNAGWVRIAGVQLQPAEFVKFALCIWLPSALLVAKRRYERAHGLWEQVKAYGVAGGIYAICLLLVLGGKDLGTAMILVFIGVVAFLISGFPGKWMAILSVLLSAVVIALVASSPNRRQRVLAAYTECSASDMQGICFQSTHAKYAIASGGIFGVGLGNSREKWNYLPAAHNDFIFAIIGEETGFIGCVMVIAIFVILGWCLIFSALQLKDRYSAMVLMCVAVWLVGQAFVNIGVVVGLFPVFGVPMPFVSAGGSSMIMCLCMSGVALGLLRQQPEVKADVSNL